MSFSISRDEVTRTLLAVQLWQNGKNRIRSYLLRCGSYGETAAMAQHNFSRMQRNSYGAYGILTEFSLRQWQHGSGRLEARHKSVRLRL